jgi:peptidoglycan/LPS O-acetylase OafA/YrhL
MDRTRAPLAAGDPLRGIAALSVVLSHIVGLAVLSWVIDEGIRGPVDAFGPVGDVVGAGGTFGVSIFFVLSGYLLSRPFLRAANGEPLPSLSRYARNRVLRIVPAYWALLAVIVLAVVLTGVADAGAKGLARTFLFDAGELRPLPLWLGHTWTLDVEMRFYVLLGVIGTGLAMLRRGVWPFAIVALAAAVWGFLAHPVFDSLDDNGILANIGRFTPGILLAVLEATRVRVPAGAGPALFGGGVVALAAASVAGQDPSFPLGDATQWALALASGAIVGGPLVWQWGGGASWRLLDNAAMRWAGSRSYSLYLVHVPVYAALLTAFADGDGYERRSLLLAGAGLPLALAAAELLHRFAEVPALRRRAPSQVVPGA